MKRFSLTAIMMVITAGFLLSCSACNKSESQELGTNVDVATSQDATLSTDVSEEDTLQAQIDGAISCLDKIEHELKKEFLRLYIAKKHLEQKVLLEKEMTSDLRELEVAFRIGKEWLADHSKADKYTTPLGEVHSHEEVLFNVNNLMTRIKISRLQIESMRKIISESEAKNKLDEKSLMEKLRVHEMVCLKLKHESTREEVLEFFDGEKLDFDGLCSKMSISANQEELLQQIEEFPDTLDPEDASEKDETE